MQDLEDVGIAVVMGDLVRREVDLKDIVADALERDGPRHVEPERLEVAGHHFHGRHTALLHLGVEMGSRPEGRIGATPQTETVGIAEILDAGGRGGRSIDDARGGTAVLQGQAGKPLERGGLGPVTHIARPRIGERMGLVERDHALEGRSQTIHELVKAGHAFIPRFRPQQGVGREDDPLADIDGRAISDP